MAIPSMCLKREGQSHLIYRLGNIYKCSVWPCRVLTHTGHQGGHALQSAPRAYEVGAESWLLLTSLLAPGPPPTAQEARLQALC